LISATLTGAFRVAWRVERGPAAGALPTGKRVITRGVTVRGARRVTIGRCNRGVMIRRSRRVTGARIRGSVTRPRGTRLARGVAGLPARSVRVLPALGVATILPLREAAILVLRDDAAILAPGVTLIRAAARICQRSWVWPRPCVALRPRDNPATAHKRTPIRVIARSRTTPISLTSSAYNDGAIRYPALTPIKGHSWRAETSSREHTAWIAEPAIGSVSGP
jgi:hypothetical protein